MVEIRNVGSWVIHRCYNCSIYTHAVHRDYGAALVLINTDIVVSITLFIIAREYKQMSYILLLFEYMNTLYSFCYRLHLRK